MSLRPSQVITFIHPYNTGHKLSTGDVKSIDRDRVEIVHLRAQVKVLRESRQIVLDLLAAFVALGPYHPVTAYNELAEKAHTLIERLGAPREQKN